MTNLANIPTAQAPSSVDVQNVVDTQVQDAVTPLGHVAETVGAVSALALSAVTGGIPASAEWVVINPEGNVRLRDDGTDASATDGLKIPAGTLYNYNGDLAAATLFSDTGGDVTVQMSFYTGTVNT